MNEIDTRNVVDKYKNTRFTKWTEELIREDIKKTQFPYAILMENFVGDFCISSLIRSANAFGASKVFYYGRKKFDKRGCVGAYIYTDVVHLETLDQVKVLKDQYFFVGLEISDKLVCKSIYDYQWYDNSLIILGEEGVGITPETLAICDELVYIPQYGSVRSLNAAVAGSVAMNDYICKYTNNTKVK